MKNNRLVFLSVCLFAVMPIFALAQTAPTISSISPDSGGVGSQATIYGSKICMATYWSSMEKLLRVGNTTLCWIRQVTQ